MAFACAMLLIGSAMCSAAVDAGKIALEPVYPGMSESALINAFGQPNYRDGDDWIYQDAKVEVEHGVVENRRARRSSG